MRSQLDDMKVHPRSCSTRHLTCSRWSWSRKRRRLNYSSFKLNQRTQSESAHHVSTLPPILYLFWWCSSNKQQADHTNIFTEEYLLQRKNEFASKGLNEQMSHTFALEQQVDFLTFFSVCGVVLVVIDGEWFLYWWNSWMLPSKRTLEWGYSLASKRTSWRRSLQILKGMNTNIQHVRVLLQVKPRKLLQLTQTTSNCVSRMYIDLFPTPPWLEQVFTHSPTIITFLGSPSRTTC